MNSVIRWRIGILLGFGVLVNYIDRVNLSVATPAIANEFGVSIVEMGFIAAAFGYLYTFLQIPIGGLLDRFGVKKITRISTIFWAISTTLTGFANGVGTLTGLRVILGASEAAAFPANAKATGYWFPLKERSFATSIFDSMAKFSNVIGVPLIALIITAWGWRSAFYVTGILSLIYAILFWIIYRDPREHSKITKEELDYIEEGGGQTEGFASGSYKDNLLYLLKQRKVWGLSLGFAAYGYTFYLFLTWLPTYLVQDMHMSLLKSGFYTALPWLVATFTDLLIGGLLPDFLIRKGKDPNLVRKSILIGGMVCGLTVLLATQTTNPNIAIIWISIALGGLAASAPISWTIPSIIAPKGMVASVGSIMNFTGNIMAILAPIITAFIVKATGSFTAGFVLAGIVLAIGIFFYIFVLGKIEQIPDREKSMEMEKKDALMS